MKVPAMFKNPQPLTAISCLSLAGCALLASAVAWASTGTDDVLVQLRADDLQVVQAGEVVYQQNCASCHGEQLEGQPDWRSRTPEGLLPAPPHDATGHTWHHADDLLFEITKYGASVVINDPDYRSSMPAYKDILSDEQIIAALSFIKNSWPDDERQWQEEINGNQTEALLPKRKSSSFLEKFSQ